VRGGRGNEGAGECRVQTGPCSPGDLGVLLHVCNRSYRFETDSGPLHRRLGGCDLQQTQLVLFCKVLLQVVIEDVDYGA
jgi:hypothetical protein